MSEHNIERELAALEKAVAATPLDPAPGAESSPPQDRTQRVFRDADHRVSRIEVSYPALGVVVVKTIVRDGGGRIAAVHEATTTSGTAAPAEPDLSKRRAAPAAPAMTGKEAAVRKIFKDRGRLTARGASWYDIAREVMAS